MPKTILWTVLAMIAFASNSVLCRVALGHQTIDAASFTLIRLASGVLTLCCIVFLKNKSVRPIQGDWISGIQLFLYAVLFSFSYLSLGAGTGALILFGAVQLTMIFAGIRAGERPGASAWIGILLAIGGFLYLVSPGWTAPSPVGAALMTGAGVAWGLYSLRGRRITNPLETTAGNFIYAISLAVIISLLTLAQAHLSTTGIALAVASGSLASGVGYVVWYAALQGLAATHAATVQLCVPVLAALGGTLFLSEAVTLRLIAASIVILLGIGVVLTAPVRGKKIPA